MAGFARYGAQAILTLAVTAVGVRLAALPAQEPATAAVAPAVRAQTVQPRPVRMTPIVVDASKVSGSIAPVTPPKPQTVPCEIADARRARGSECVAAQPLPAATPTPAGYVIRRILDTHGPIRFGTWFWDEAGVPAGPIVITVDTKASVLSIFRGGYEIGTTAVIYGDDGMPTPLGVFPITQKDARHVSNLYHAPMPYMQRLTNDGVSIHGSPIAADYATHGCVGVPIPFAKKLFGATRLGDRVIVTRGETLNAGARINAI